MEHQKLSSLYSARLQSIDNYIYYLQNEQGKYLEKKGRENPSKRTHLS